MHAGMLPDVERVQLEAEGPYFAQQLIDAGSSQAFSAVGLQARSNQRDVVLEFRCAAVGCGSFGGFAALLQPVKHIGEKPAVALSPVVRSPCQMHTRNRALIVHQVRKQLRSGGVLAARRTEAVADRVDVVEILAEDQTASRIQRIASALWLYQRVAIAVPANPGTELHQVGQVGLVEFESVNVAE